MALKPDVNHYPGGEKDPDYVAAVKDAATRPEAWNATAEGGVESEMAPAPKKALAPKGITGR